MSNQASTAALEPFARGYSSSERHANRAARLAVEISQRGRPVISGPFSFFRQAKRVRLIRHKPDAAFPNAFFSRAIIMRQASVRQAKVILVPATTSRRSLRTHRLRFRFSIPHVTGGIAG
jgi:hypothetical protein